MAKYVGALDQGTTSTRFMIFDHGGNVVAIDQKEHEQIYPKPGWVEHDPKEIWARSQEVTRGALSNAGIQASDLAAVGVTNQRETAVVWDRTTGEPVYNAIVWQDTCTQPIVDRLAADGGVERFKQDVGLPLATYFSGTKIVWILENVEGARAKAEAGDLLFGTTDCWVLWNLTGGVDGGVHATDVTNASRTMFMDLATLEWRDDILAAFGVPRSMMPAIRASSEVYGTVEPSSLLREVPVAGILGEFVDERLFSLALLIDLDALARWFFDRPQDDSVSVGVAWMAVIGLVCLCWAVIAWRLRRLEVVA